MSNSFARFLACASANLWKNSTSICTLHEDFFLIGWKSQKEAFRIDNLKNPTTAQKFLENLSSYFFHRNEKFKSFPSLWGFHEWTSMFFGQAPETFGPKNANYHRYFFEIQNHVSPKRQSRLLPPRCTSITFNLHKTFGVKPHGLSLVLESW